MSFAIRRADPADPADGPAIEAAGVVSRTAYVDGGHIPGRAEYAGRLADAASRAREAELWLAVDPDGTVLGSVTFAVGGSSYAEVSVEGEGEFRMLAVGEQARGRGVGEALVRRCVERARELGLSALAISTQPTMSAAHRLYERLGFTRAPELDWKPVPEVDLMTYRLTL
ncbi:GNAT family N-acetyltransferase [Pedococcus aerophilus]